MTQWGRPPENSDLSSQKQESPAEMPGFFRCVFNRPILTPLNRRPDNPGPSSGEYISLRIFRLQRTKKAPAQRAGAIGRTSPGYKPGGNSSLSDLANFECFAVNHPPFFPGKLLSQLLNQFRCKKFVGFQGHFRKSWFIILHHRWFCLRWEVWSSL